jgi:predicted nucleic acid-binding protein
MLSSSSRFAIGTVTSGSDFIVTGDKDLLRLGRYDAIPIVTVADFLAQGQERQL